MKRSFFISLLLHGAILFFFFSWGIPLSERPFARNVIQVLLVAEAEEGREGGRSKKEKNEEMKNAMQKGKTASRNDSRGKNLPPKKAKPAVENPKRKPEGFASTPVAREEKENPEQKPEGNEYRVSEEKEQNLDPERKNDPQPDLGLPSQTKEPARKGSIPQPSTLKADARFDSPPTLLASGSPLMGGEGISLGGETPSSTDGPSRQMSRTEISSSEGDSILAEIVGKIEAAKRYPRTARRMGIQGTATVRFKLKPNGQLEKIELMESSGSKILDDASLETVREAAPLPYREGWLKVGIVFKIL